MYIHLFFKIFNNMLIQWNLNTLKCTVPLSLVLSVLPRMIHRDIFLNRFFVVFFSIDSPHVWKVCFSALSKCEENMLKNNKQVQWKLAQLGSSDVSSFCYCHEPVTLFVLKFCFVSSFPVLFGNINFPLVSGTLPFLLCQVSDCLP